MDIFNLLIAIIPSIIIGIISIISLIYTNRRQDKVQIDNFRSQKIEQFYGKLLSVNGSVNAEIVKYKSDDRYWLDQNNSGLIIKEIELLKVEAILYFGIDQIDLLRLKCERLLNELVYKDGSKKNITDGEYEKDGDAYITLVPSTLQRSFDQYEEVYDSIESTVEDLTRKSLGIKKHQRVIRKKKK